MATLFQQVQAKRDEILLLSAKYGAYNVRVFGSVARGDAHEASDVDFLVDFEPGRSLFDWSGLWGELELLLGRKVDVASVDSLKPRMLARVLAEAKPL